MRFSFIISTSIPWSYGINGDGKIIKKKLEALALEKDMGDLFIGLFNPCRKSSFIELYESRLLVIENKS